MQFKINQQLGIMNCEALMKKNTEQFNEAIS